MKKKTCLSALAVLSAVAAVGSVVLAQSARSDALEISGSRADPGQAVTAVERHVGGKTSPYEYERPKGQWVFDAKKMKGAPVWT